MAARGRPRWSKLRPWYSFPIYSISLHCLALNYIRREFPDMLSGTKYQIDIFHPPRPSPIPGQ